MTLSPIPERALRVHTLASRALDVQTSNLARCAFASIAASYAMANALDFSLRGTLSLLLLSSSQASLNFSDAKKSLLFVASALSYIFAFLFHRPSSLPLEIARETRLIRYVPPEEILLSSAALRENEEQLVRDAPPQRLVLLSGVQRVPRSLMPPRETRLIRYVPPEEILFSSIFAALREEEERLVRSFTFIDLEEIVERHEQVQDKQPPLLEQLSRVLISKKHVAKDMKYRHVLQQMAACVEEVDINTLSGTKYQLLYVLRHPEEFIDVRHQYWKCIQLLREACEQGSEDPLGLAYMRFCQLNLSGYHRGLVEAASGPFESSLSLATLKEELERRNTALANLPQELDIPEVHRLLQKLRGFLNFLFDPLMGSNIPHLRALLEWSKGGTKRVVSLLRHGTPVTQTDLQRFVFLPPALITPDYTAFIRSGKRTLHVIVEYGRERTVGDESMRVSLRMGLQSFPNFFPLALPLDGSFFNQKATDSLETLQDLLITEMYSPSSAFRFAEKLQFQEELPRLFKEVREIFFSSAAISDLATHQSYILLCYAHLITYLQARYNIEILEMGCKDDIDRGNILKTILELYSLILLEKENDPEALQTVMINTLAAPLMVKKQGVISSRFSLLLSVLDIFNQMTPQQKTALRNADREGWVLKDYSLPLTDQQGLYPTAASAGTRQEYYEFLMHLALENAWELPRKADNLVEDLAKTRAFLENGVLSKTKIFDQIARDLRRFEIFAGEHQISSPEELENFLTSRGVAREDLLKILSCCQQGMIADATAGLTELFTNVPLNIRVIQDPSQDGPLKMHLRVDAQNGVAALHFISLACVRTGEDFSETIANVGVSTTIEDHRTGVHRHLVFAR